MAVRTRIKTALLAAALGATALPAQEGGDAVRREVQLPDAACADPAAQANAAAGVGTPVLLEGLGYAGVEPDSGDPQARAWFAQGVRLIWAFDEVEAVRAFRMAQQKDPACALCHWGEAWARSPTINLRPRTEELAAARSAALRAEALGQNLSPRDRLLVAAMVERTKGETFDNARYAARLETAALRIPADDLLATLAADARMVAERPSAFQPGSLTQRLLERVIARTPGHGGAIHLYIHLTDWIDRPHLAAPHADRLGTIAPAASHLVHMPSHSYFGVGRYADAARVNVEAIAADRAFVAATRPVPSFYRTALLGHNMHFAITSALMRGDGATALDVAAQFRDAYLSGGEVNSYAQLIGSAVYYAAGVHGDPDALLPASDVPLARAMTDYARGEAAARAGDAEGVARAAAAIRTLGEGSEAPQLGSQMAARLVEVAQHVLDGRAAMLRGDPAAAERAYRAGMERQLTGQFGADPPLFWYSVRRSLGAALLAQGQHESAKQQLLASLRRWPNDALALYALSLAHRGLGETDLADRNLARARAGWAGAVEAVPLSRI
jgi:tetratricopeptide (TPR) repeat protein